MTPPTRLVAARLLAGQVQPFLAEALYAMTPIARPGLDTFAVDQRWRLYFDPDRLDRWSVEEVAGVLLHEAAHLVRDHLGRARDAGVDHDSAHAWNVAADAEINDGLRHDGVRLPSGGVLPQRLGLPPGRAAEFYFEKLRGRSPLPPCACGSGVHGVGAESVERQDGSDVGGVTTHEANLIRRQVALAIRARAASGGYGAGGWLRWAEAFVSPQVNWRRQLRTAFRQNHYSVAGRVDYSYARPSRRPFCGVVMPSLVQPLPHVGVVIDTSGSMDEERLSLAWTEIVALCRAQSRHLDGVTVWAVDTVASLLRGGLGRKVQLVGGGGTDLRVGVATAMRHRPRPGLLVLLTDGETPWPDESPGVPVVVVIMPHGDRVGLTPPWARAIEIRGDR